MRKFEKSPMQEEEGQRIESGEEKEKKVLCANERKTNKNIQTHLITVGKQENVLACVSLHASKASVHAAMDV